MQIEVKILSDTGEVLAFHAGEAMQPLQFKLPYEHPLVEEIKDEKGKLVAQYQLHGFTYQPMVKLVSKESY